MGLIKEGDDYIVLTDIAGVEDHLGDMDFKVAGTDAGITALQMDIKISGVTFDILRDALTQAREARQFILGKMAEAISRAAARALSRYAPRIEKVKIDPSQIGLLSARAARPSAACARSSTPRSTSTTTARSDLLRRRRAGRRLVERIRAMMKEVEVGDEYLGKVVKTTTFGAFIELSKGTDGLLHISNVSPGNRVDTVEEVLSKGDEVAVRVVEVDRERGRIGVRRADDPEIAGKTVEELVALARGGGDGGARAAAPARGRPQRGPRGGRTVARAARRLRHRELAAAGS